MVRNLISLLSLLFITSCDYVLTQNDTHPVVVITFDDGDYSIYQTAFPFLDSLGFDATHFLPTSYIGEGAYTTLAQLQEMEAAGWETGGHGIDHGNLSALPLDSAKRAIDSSFNYLVTNNLSHQSYAYAFGNYSPELITYTKTKFKNIRTSHDMLYLSGVDRSELGYFALRNFNTTADIIHRIERANLEGAQLVIIGFHALRESTEEKPSSYWIATTTFKEFALYLKEKNYTVLPLHSAIEYLLQN